jgi:hypothetical protein
MIAAIVFPCSWIKRRNGTRRVNSTGTRQDPSDYNAAGTQADPDATTVSFDDVSISSPAD